MRGLPALVLSVTLAAAAGDPGTGATLQVANRKVFTFRATVAGSTPAERLASAQARLEQVPTRGPVEQVETRPVQLGSDKGTAVLVGPRLLFIVAEGDVDLQAGETTEGVARQAAQVLTEAQDAEREQRSVRLLVRSLLLALVATTIAAGLLWLFVRARRAAHAGVAGISRREPFRLWGVDFGPTIRSTLRGLVFILFWALVLSVVEVWLTYVLSLFPLTRPWSDALLGSVLRLLSGLGRKILGGVPDLLTAVVILLIGRAVARFVSNVVHRVEEGTATLPGVYPETAGATRRLLVGMVWLITIAAAYPYLPGSGSEAFKALSLVVGLGLSLGSTGIVAQAMSGLVVIYSRALSRGDCVRIGDIEGVVTEVHILSTRILTIQGEEVTIPNTVVVNGPVKNFGRASKGQGALVSARVSIGYDAPWRKVHALLLDAARDTAGLRADPAPYVLQRALDDFYVQYELVAAVKNPVDRPLVASALHARIQDGFNAAGLQIMSPHFVLQPRQPVLGEAAPAPTAEPSRVERPAAASGPGR
ncbi:MAG TPA: mechanosensitive ion channel domain-containing protein [Myxococcaceae bacterium]|nr:mechanosensitive ion channel domain-containing protein [Myxococcaceae bacterium]